MSDSQATVVASRLRMACDGVQHCTVVREPQGKTVAMDGCTASGGKGQEFSPANLVGSGLAGCMLFSMGIVALRDDLDLIGTTVDIDVSLTETRIGAIELTFSMPRSFTAEDRIKLERAAGRCPIKPSFHPDIPISVRFEYPS